MPSLAEKSKIKILYKSRFPSYSTAITVYNIEPAIQNFNHDVS
jgi:hypothetical protein